MNTETHRIARFSIPANFIHSCWPLIRKLMAGCVVTSAVYDYARREIDYSALSDAFPEVPVGQEPPTLELAYIRVPNASGGQDLVDIQFKLPPI